MPHVYDPDFKYVTAKDSRVEDDYLRKKFKRIIAEQKQQQKEAAKKLQPTNVRQWRQA